MTSRTSHSSTEAGAHIVHLTTVHHPQDPRITKKQLPTLHEAGFEVTLVASGRDDEMPTAIPHVSLPSSESRIQRLPLLWTAYRRACALHADVYQIHDPELIPVGFLLKQKMGAPIIYDMHENYGAKGKVLGWGLRVLERWCFGWADHVLVAEESYRPIVENHGRDPTYIGNYFKPVEAADSSAAPKDDRGTGTATPTRLLYTGTIANKRGLHVMLDLASSIQRRGRAETIKIVGICRHADQRAAAEARIRQENLHSVVECVGWTEYVAPSTMVPYYQWADVGLVLFRRHPNFVESMPTKFYEYLYYGLPIICSDFPLWVNFVDKYDCGIAVTPGDEEAVLGTLRRWQENPEEYQTYMRNARATASEYRWEAMADRLVQVYRDLLAGLKA